MENCYKFCKWICVINHSRFVPCWSLASVNKLKFSQKIYSNQKDKKSKSKKEENKKRKKLNKKYYFERRASKDQDSAGMGLKKRVARCKVAQYSFQLSLNFTNCFGNIERMK